PCSQSDNSTSDNRNIVNHRLFFESPNILDQESKLNDAGLVFIQFGNFISDWTLSQRNEIIFATVLIFPCGISK
ncbi:MAG TPA: hypothetical protein DCS64_01050, partial [Algoriphagus sp.]|nr:hypothetical protein [Algoriphagus sp.]